MAWFSFSTWSFFIYYVKICLFIPCVYEYFICMCGAPYA